MNPTNRAISAALCGLLLSACTDTPTATSTATSVASERPPTAQPAPTGAPSARAVASFAGTFDPTTGALDVHLERAAGDALYCERRVTSGRPDTLSLETVDGTIQFTPTDCGFDDVFPYDTLGMFCFDAAVTSHAEDVLLDVFAEITGISPDVGHNAYRFPYGTGADPSLVIPGPFAPEDVNGLWHHGDIAPGETSVRRWAFEYSPEPFTFRGRLMAAMPERLNGLDDNCDGVVDETPLADGETCTSDEECYHGWCPELTGRCAEPCGPDTWGPDCTPCNCDDGLYCNGEESCDPELGCLPGVPIDPDDGALCTVDTCSDELATTVHTPDDALCDDANECTADMCLGLDCFSAPVADGTLCTDCVTGECACNSGSCVSTALNADGYEYRRLAGGYRHACVLDEAGQTTCWGGGEAFSPPFFPAPVEGFVHVTAGGGYTCGLTATGVVECDYFDAFALPPLDSEEGGFVFIEGSNAALCGLEPSGTVRCSSRDVPELADAPVSSEGGYVDMELGFQFGCALEPTGAVDCWGRDHVGDPAPAPPASTEGGYADLLGSNESYAMCAREPSGAIRCWGNNPNGFEQYPAMPDGTYEAGVVTQLNACGLDGGVPTCTDLADAGVATPLLSAEGGYVELVAGDNYACALEPSGAVQCWGDRVGTGLFHPPML